MSNQEPTFDAVMFDLDGVLVESEPWWNGVRVEFAREHGRSWSPDDEDAMMGGNSREWATVMRERLDLAHLTADEIQDAIVAGVVERYRTATVLPIIPGAAETVRRVAATHPVAVASSAHRAIIEAAVDALGLHGVLDQIVSSDDVDAGKPDPGVYLLAASRLGVQPARCLVVEDSVNGVRAGKAAGMTVALVPNAGVPSAIGVLELADLVLERITDLDPGPPARPLWPTRPLRP
jgi:HAD superfamily hydrolase (TIGR01509 family)